MTHLQLVALKYICRRPDCSQKELAHELGCGVKSAHGMMERLKLNGLVYRPNGYKNFSLTRAGVEALAA
jgi:predicted transcriptional regulator